VSTGGGGGGAVSVGAALSAGAGFAPFLGFFFAGFFGGGVCCVVTSCAFAFWIANGASARSTVVARATRLAARIMARAMLHMIE
jgi:hypothetical protein